MAEEEVALLRQILTPAAQRRLEAIIVDYPWLRERIEKQLLALARFGRRNMMER